MFNSLKRRYGMADVGKTASGKLTDALKATMDASPNYANMQMRGMKAQNLVERQKIESNAAVKRADW